jgi:hypothetical protein
MRFDVLTPFENLETRGRHPLRPSGTSPSKLEGGRNLTRSPNLLGELSEGLRGSLPQVQHQK